MKNKQSLSEKHTNLLLQEIKSGRFSHSMMLPPEQELAKDFGISRTLVRDCLSVLEREGFISRKHGIGTLINQHVLNIRTRIDLEEEFLDMVRNAGKSPTTRFVKNDEIQASATIASALLLKEGDIVIRSERLIEADGTPAIYCNDYIPKKNVVTTTYDAGILDKPIFDFIGTYCHAEVHMDLSEVNAVIADDYTATMLGVAPGCPLLSIHDIGYDFFGKPLLYSEELYVEGIFKQTILRKKI
ncbi:MAG: GntR family transcriptional regulator [Sphaerochaetaceae bacterium]|nr:GntR family transcriptional regulator [Sphaerochaetaceae bacterium]